MALKLNKSLKNGCICNYHRITEAVLNVSDEEKTIYLTLRSYLNQEKRIMGATEMDVNYFTFNVENEEDANGNLREYGYEQIKKLSNWSEAEDI